MMSGIRKRNAQLYTPAVEKMIYHDLISSLQYPVAIGNAESEVLNRLSIDPLALGRFDCNELEVIRAKQLRLFPKLPIRSSCGLTILRQS